MTDISNEYPTAITVRGRRGIPLVWLVPLVAILVGVGLVVKTAMERGPGIVVTFKSADGIEPGKTKVRYKNVEIGTVERVDLARDRDKVEVSVQMNKSAAAFLVEDTRFWVEKPRIRGTTVEGLGTLLSGAFIGMDIGKSDQRRREFVGLDQPPLVTFTEPGQRYRLHANQLGSIESGSPVFYRRVGVGQVVRYEMDAEGKGVDIEIFIKAPYDRFIHAQTRFWEASGIDLEMNAQGIRVDTQSLNSILAGGIAFETSGKLDEVSPVTVDTKFFLHQRKADAIAIDDFDAIPMRLIFNESVRGLSVGAPVEFRGIEAGRVTAIGGFFDKRQGIVKMTVDIALFPNRLRVINVRQQKGIPNFRKTMDLLVSGGLRAQLRTGNLVSGQLMISLDFFKGSPQARIDWSDEPPVFPTTVGSLVDLEARAVELMKTANRLLKKLEAVPLDQLSEDVRTVINSLDRSIHTLDKTLQGVDRQLAEDSALQMDLRETLHEVERTAAEARNWLDYQSRHPESLLMGKPKEK
jgi:paraquat-inducible protein B